MTVREGKSRSGQRAIRSHGERRSSSRSETPRRNGAGVQHLSRLPRCVNLCTAFPTLFDLVDASATLEVDGVEKSQFWKVVDQVLPLRHVLHDEMPVCSAATLERGFPAP